MDRDVWTQGWRARIWEAELGERLPEDMWAQSCKGGRRAGTLSIPECTRGRLRAAPRSCYVLVYLPACLWLVPSLWARV